MVCVLHLLRESEPKDLDLDFIDFAGVPEAAASVMKRLQARVRTIEDERKREGEDGQSVYVLEIRVVTSPFVHRLGGHEVYWRHGAATKIASWDQTKEMIWAERQLSGPTVSPSARPV